MLTICIPTFNRCNYLNDLLASIYNADKKAKIIVVNNCSADRTKIVVSKFKKKFKYLKYFSHKKKKTNNKNYIFFLNKIKEINFILKKKVITGITCNYNLIEKNKLSKKSLRLKKFNIDLMLEN